MSGATFSRRRLLAFFRRGRDRASGVLTLGPSGGDELQVRSDEVTKACLTNNDRPTRVSRALAPGLLTAMFTLLVAASSCGHDAKSTQGGDAASDTAGDASDMDSSADLDGALVCNPGQRTCSGAENNEILECDELGQATFLAQTCDPGLECFNGFCLDPCASDIKASVNVGCDYFAVDLQNGDVTLDVPPEEHPSNANFAVIVSNPHPVLSLEVAVHDRFGGDVIDVQSLAPRELHVFELGTRNTIGTSLGAESFYLSGTRPFIAYQFNPLDNDRPVFSNDASLLLPAGGVGTDYIALTGARSGFVTVVGVFANTEVTVTPTATIASGAGVPTIAAAATHTATVHGGTVLNLSADAAGDLSGTTISATKPVVVFSGNRQTRTAERCCADHLEQQLLPISTWGTSVVAASSIQRGLAPDYWRVVAAADTTLTFDPPVIAERAVTAGEVVEVVSRQSFVVTADQPIQVVQILASSHEATSQGQPCAADADCKASERCLATSPGGERRCLALCEVGSSDCEHAGSQCLAAGGPGEVSVGNGHCLPTPCNGAADCSGPAVCRSGFCTNECAADTSCSASAGCLVLSDGAQVCIGDACDQDSGCGGSAQCFPFETGARCAESCPLPDACPDAGYRCLPGRFFGDPVGPNRCVEPACASDADCPTGHLCSGERCEPVGDPAMLVMLSTNQFRSDFVFLVPSGFVDDYITVVGPRGAVVELDGVALGPPTEQLADFDVWRRPISDGVHVATSSEKFSISVYGFDNDVSYGYPAGAALSDK